MYFHQTHPVLWIVAEKQLSIGVFLTLVAIVGTTIDLTTILGTYGKVVRDIDTIIHQLCLDVLIEHLEIYSLTQRLVAGGIENAVYYFIQQSLLINIAILHNLPHRLCCRGYRILVITEDHRLWHLRRLGVDSLQLERRINITIGTCLFLKISQGLVELKIS